MATLEEDLYTAFAGSTVGDQFAYKTDEGKIILDETEDDGNIKRLAKDVATAIHEWITKQTFTIIEMKAVAEMEKIVESKIGAINTLGSPSAQKSSMFTLSKGSMSSFGHAYIGMPAATVKGAAGSSDTTTGQWNTYSKVKLNPNTKEALYKPSTS